MIVVDSSVWIDFLNGNATPEVGRLSALLGAEPLLVGDVILLVPMFDPELALIAATNGCSLRTVGITMRKTIELIIGTFCIVHGHALLKADRDFAPMAEHLELTQV